MANPTILRCTSLLPLSVLALVLSFATQAADLVYVQSKQAKVFKSPAFNAPVVVMAAKGAALEKLAQEGRWLKVNYQEQQGWVPELLVGPRPPLKKISVIDDEAADLKQNARRRASATTSTAAARGLRNDDRARQSDDAVSDYSALTEMDDFAVSDDEAQEFLDQRQ